MLKDCVKYKRFVWELENTIKANNFYDNIVILCIGTSLINGDSFGPKVGTMLRKNLINNKKITVIGDTRNSITYNKIKYCKNYIDREYKNSLIIAIDAALSDKADIGKIFIHNRGLKYAESLKKENELIGNISIKGVVGENVNNSIENFKNLRNASKENIYLMSYLVSKGIAEVMNKKENNGKNIYKRKS